MHIRDGILSQEVCAVSGALALAAVGYSLWRVGKEETPQSKSLVGAVAALIFAGQMVNFPLVGLPASGHLLGGVLAATLLGPWAGCLALTAVVAVQALVFGDGGLQALGANVVNMAVVGCWGGSWLRMQFERLSGTTLVGRLTAAGSAAWVSIILAAVCFCLEFVASAGWNGLAVGALFREMLGYHALIGLGEAAITMAVLAWVWSRENVTSGQTAQVMSQGSLRLAVVGFLIACLVATVLSPWASELPDGLEAVGERLAFNELGRDSVLLLSDYAFPVPSGWESLSVSAAGLFGTCVVLLAARLLLLPAHHRKA